MSTSLVGGPAFFLLLVFVPGVALAGVLAAQRIVDRDEVPLLAPGLAIVFLLTVAHVASLGFGSTHIGVPIGIVVVGAVGYLRWSRRVEAPRGVRVPRAIYLLAAVAIVILAPAIFAFNFHDEVPFTGHLSMTSTIVNGPYPPHHLSYPESLLRYHYAFDLLAAIVAMLFALRADTAIDVVTTFLAGYTVLATWLVVRRTTNGRAPIAFALLLLFAGGLPFLAPFDGEMCRSTLGCKLQSMQWIGSSFVAPPTISAFFQHPFTLGIPLALVTVAVFLDTCRAPSVLRAVLLGATLAILSLSQIVLYAELAPTMAVVLAFFAVRDAERRRMLLVALGCVAASALLARLYGGFFAESDLRASGSLLFDPSGVARGLENSLVWHFASFGVFLPLGFLGVSRLASGRLLVFGTIAGSLLVLNLLRYRYSGDIEKFAFAGHLFLAIASMETLRLLVQDERRSRRVLGWGSFGLGIAWGLAYVIPFWTTIAVPHWPALEGDERYPGLTTQDTDALDWMRANVAGGDLTYRRYGPATIYTQLGGIPTVWGFDVGAEGFGISEARMNRRRTFLRGFDCRLLVAEDVRWVVLDEDDPRGAHGVMTKMVEAGSAEEAASFETVKVYRRVGDGC